MVLGFLYKKNNKKSIDYYFDNNNFSVNKNLILLLSVFSTILYFSFNSFNIEALIFRGFDRNKTGTELHYFLFINSIIRNIPFILLLFYKVFLKNKCDFKNELVLFLCLILCNFPTGISRFQLAVVYLPIAILYINYLQKNKNFIYSFVLGLLFVFPYLHHFRYNLKVKSNNVFNFKMFNELHFDSFQHTLSIIKLELITFGNQLLGAIFFFIPREFWNKKPFSSGYVLGEQLNYNYKNIAVSFFGEGYINFGFIGLFLFVLMLVKTNVFLDSLYLKGTGNLVKTLYLPILFIEFFMLRGSLLSSISKFCTFAIAYFFVYLILRKVNKNNDVY